MSVGLGKRSEIGRTDKGVQQKNRPSDAFTWKAPEFRRTSSAVTGSPVRFVHVSVTTAVTDGIAPLCFDFATDSRLQEPG